MAKEEEELVDRGDVYLPEGHDEDPADEDYEELEGTDEDEEEDEDESDEDSEDDDESDEDEEDEEGKEDEEDDDDEEEEDDDNRGNKIPRARLNQVLRQRDEERELRREQSARMEWLEKQLESLIQKETRQAAPKEPEPDPYDFDSAEEQYIELILQGETKQATALRKEINKARDVEYDRQVKAAKEAAAEDAVNKAESSRDEERFQMLLEDITEEYAFLDDQSDDYNEKAVRMANNLMASYIQDGKSKSMALKMAVEDILPYFEKPKQEEETPKPSKRKTEARRKAAKASSQQPPSSKGVKGKKQRDFDAGDIERMSEKQFKELTAREKAKLRGDIL